VSNLPPTLTDATATVSNVADTVSDEAFEGNSVLLLDADYLKVMDTVSTRGHMLTDLQTRTVIVYFL